MNQDYKDSENLFDLSIDELIADAKAQIGSDHGRESFAVPAEQTAPVDVGFDIPVEQEAPMEESFAIPDEFFRVPEEPAPKPVVAEPAAQNPDEFELDFGSAFDDYGEYVAPDAEEKPAVLPPDEADPGPMPKKPRRNRKKRIVPLFVKILLYLVLVSVSAVGLGYGAWECAQDVLGFGRSEDSLTVVVKEGDTVADIAQMLKEKGVIKYPWLFELYCEFTKSMDTMDPGNYVLYYNYDYHALVSGMVERSPNRVTVRLTIPEGYTAAQIFSMMEKKGVCTVAELEECAATHEFDYWFLEGIPYGESNRLEGFLFPDTYDFYEKDDPARALNKLLVNFDNKFSKRAEEQLEELNAKLAERWASRGYSQEYIDSHRFGIYELMTVASMIEKETSSVAESGKISSVIYNRLCKPDDFPCLQIDATVVYALGGVDHALTYEDLEVDSPYNTYIYSGLPKGPISNPGLNSIAAALKPTDTSYYFYALDPSTGAHYFSKTLREHTNFLEGLG